MNNFLIQRLKIGFIADLIIISADILEQDYHLCISKSFTKDIKLGILIVRVNLCIPVVHVYILIYICRKVGRGRGCYLHVILLCSLTLFNNMITTVSFTDK